MPLSQIEFLGVLIRADVGDVALPENKRLKYGLHLREFVAEYQAAIAIPRKPVERLLGRLGFAARCYRFGYLFLQNCFDALYGQVGNVPEPFLNPSPAFWGDLAFWRLVLDKQAAPLGGYTRLFMEEVLFDPFNSESSHHLSLYTDASTSFGWGAVFQGHVISEAWSGRDRSEHICWLELSAIRRALTAFKEHLGGKCVVVRTDSKVAEGALNKGHSRHGPARQELMLIVVLAIISGFEVCALHIAGVDNPADAPSRGVAISFQDWTFRHFSQFCDLLYTVDCCADPSGYNSRCPVWFSWKDPVQLNVPKLVGQVLWACPPWSIIASVLDAVLSAWNRDPIRTKATVVLPLYQDSPWYRHHFARSNRKFRTLHVYPSGSQVFFKHVPLRRAFPSELASPTPVAVFVARLS